MYRESVRGVFTALNVILVHLFPTGSTDSSVS